MPEFLRTAHHGQLRMYQGRRTMATFWNPTSCVLVERRGKHSQLGHSFGQYQQSIAYHQKQTVIHNAFKIFDGDRPEVFLLMAILATFPIIIMADIAIFRILAPPVKNVCVDERRRRR